MVWASRFADREISYMLQAYILKTEEKTAVLSVQSVKRGLVDDRLEWQ